MIVGTATATINQPLDQVFKFVVVDFGQNYCRWSPEVKHLEILTDGPLQVGSKARQIRVDQGRESDTCFQVIDLQPMRKFCFAELSQKFNGEYTMNKRVGGTELRFEFRLQKLEFYMRPFEKLIRIAIQDGAERTVFNIKRLMESDSVRST